MEFISSLAIPLVICGMAALMLFSNKPYFDSFTEGAREGLATSVKLLPTLVALLVAVNMLNASGALDFISGLIAPLCAKIGVPAEIVPLLLTRPVSGSASTATFSALIEKYGADSFAGLCAAVIMGSSDTIIYVTAVYFSSVGVKKTRHALPAAFLVMLFCVFISCLVCRIFFNSP